MPIRVRWKGKALSTIGELISALSEIHTTAEAELFAEEFERMNPDGYKMDLGYLARYLSDDEFQRICKLFNVVHPFIKPGENPLQAGIRLGEAMINGAKLRDLALPQPEGMPEGPKARNLIRTSNNATCPT